MTLIVTTNRVPRKDCIDQLNKAIRGRGGGLMNICKTYNIAHLYQQYYGWIKGNRSTKRHLETFVNTLIDYGIVSEVIYEQ